jgi:hypothetical protein
MPDLQYNIDCPCGGNNIHLTHEMEVNFGGNDRDQGVTLKGWCENGCLVDVHLFHHEGNLFVDIDVTGHSEERT